MGIDVTLANNISQVFKLDITKIYKLTLFTAIQAFVGDNISSKLVFNKPATVTGAAFGIKGVNTIFNDKFYVTRSIFAQLNCTVNSTNVIFTQGAYVPFTNLNQKSVKKNFYFQIFYILTNLDRV